MKGLIYRDLYIQRKNIIISISMYLLVGMIFVLIDLSCKFGNLAKMDDLNIDGVSKFFPMMCSACLLAGCGTSLADDVKSKWLTYSYTLPVSPKKYSASIMINMGIKIVVVEAVLFLTECGFALLEEREISKIVILAALAILIYVIGMGYTVPILLRFKNSALGQGFIALICLILYVSMMLLMLKGLEYEGDKFPEIKEDMILFAALEEDVCKFFKSNIELITAGVIVFIAALGGSLYVLTVKALKRREG